jgi:hypothetical protein
LTKPNIKSANGNVLATGMLSGNEQGEKRADLNDIFRNVLENYTVDRGIIFRCDKLPIVKADPEYFSCLFDALVSMITAHPPVGSKLFLYIKCFPEKLDDDIIDLSKEGKETLYRIEIYSNITTDENWEMLYKARLADCKLQATKISGHFSFSPITNTGCLFSLTLRGKIS